MTGRIATLMVIAILTTAVAARQPQPVVDTGSRDVDGRDFINDPPPGDYILELEARSLLESVRIVKREIEIRVRE